MSATPRVEVEPSVQSGNSPEYKFPVANIETLLHDDLTLQVDCIDRIYLHGYVPELRCLGRSPISSPGTAATGRPPLLISHVTKQFVRAIKAFPTSPHAHRQVQALGAQGRCVAKRYFTLSRHPRRRVLPRVPRSPHASWRPARLRRSRARCGGNNPARQGRTRATRSGSPAML